jgi:deoxyribose-phosphate aldolase
MNTTLATTEILHETEKARKALVLPATLTPPVSLPMLSQAALAAMIDHTALKPETTVAQIETLCSEAAQYKFASVCINPSFVSLCVQRLTGTGVKVCTVIGFPLGATSTASKVAETKRAIADGATEVDMVIHIGRLKSGDRDYVAQDVALVAQAAHEGGAILKVIIETGLLTDEEKIIACLLSKFAGADFVKTSTGFAAGGATEADIALMRLTVGPVLGVKASGGVRTHADALAMISRGATRLGASAGVAIVSGGKSAVGGY